MSALSYINEYGSDTSESDSEVTEVPSKPKKVKLQVPDLSRIAIVPTETHIDDPNSHGGRKRAFPHVRGNWASYVYINYPESEWLYNLINKLQSEICTIQNSCQKCEDIHISVSKTFVLRYHLIASFTTSLQEAICDLESFNLSVDSVKVYCNEDNTRTFVALEVDHHSAKFLKNIVQKVDEVLSDYKLPTFYHDPSFHASILWLKGNKKKEVTLVLDNLNDILYQELRHISESVHVNNVNCKIGNKFFQFSLQ